MDTEFEDACESCEDTQGCAECGECSCWCECDYEEDES